MNRLLVVLAVACARAAPAQEPAPRSDIPGAHLADQCRRAPFPPELPPLDSVFDTTLLAAGLRSAQVSDRIVFSLRLGGLQVEPRVRVLDRKVSDAVATLSIRAVEAAIRDIAPDRPWAFRLRVEGRDAATIRLERSQLCSGQPRQAPVARSRVMTMPAAEAERLMREAEETQRRLRSMRHRVLVAATGQVMLVQLANSSGDAEMDAARTEWLRDASFTPTNLDGLPVSAWIEIPGDHGMKR